MTLTEWRQDKRKVRDAYALLNTETAREMLTILKDSDPLHMQSRNLPYGGTVTPQDHSRLLGLCEGYALAIDYLESFAILPPVPPSDIVPTFADPSKPINRKRKYVNRNPNATSTTSNDSTDASA